MALEDRNSLLSTCGEMVHKEGITVVEGCTPSTLGYIVLLAFFGLVALSGPAARLIMRWRALASENSVHANSTEFSLHTVS